MSRWLSEICACGLRRKRRERKLTFFLFSFHGPSLYMGLEFRGHCLVESWGAWTRRDWEGGDHGSDSGTRSDSFLPLPFSIISRILSNIMDSEHKIIAYGGGRKKTMELSMNTPNTPPSALPIPKQLGPGQLYPGLTPHCTPWWKRGGKKKLDSPQRNNICYTCK